jgi:hypothetical protein
MPRKPPNRNNTKKPVIAVRVPRSLYVAIKRAAKNSGRNLSDEMAWQLGLAIFIFDKSFHFDRDRLEMRDE